MSWFKKYDKTKDPEWIVGHAKLFLPFQILAMNFGLTRGDWERVKWELERVGSTGDAVADFVFATRVAGVEVNAPADWGMEPWDARAARKEGTE